MKFEHIGYIVRNIKGALPYFAELGYLDASEPVSDFDRGVRICFLKGDCLPLIELVEQVSANSDISALMKRGYSGPYHLCFSSDSISKDIELLKTQGYTIVSPLKTAPAMKGKNVIFMFHAQLGLLEIASLSEEK